MKRLILTVVIILLAMLAVDVVTLLIFPVASMDVGVRQLEDSNVVFQEVQALEHFKNIFGQLMLIVAGLLCLIVWLKPIKKVLFSGR